MGSWWLDESDGPTPGPPESEYQSFAEIWAGFGGSIRTLFDPYTRAAINLNKAFDEMSSALWDTTPLKTAAAELIIQKEREDREAKEHEFKKTDYDFKVPAGTSAQLFRTFGEISERRQKREIGRGNVSGLGPRTNTTFRHGRKQY